MGTLDAHLPDDRDSELDDIRRRLHILETTPRATKTSVTNGTITVLDNSDVLRAQFGLLQDGSYGVGVLDPSGNFVSLASYIFGTTDNEITTSEACTSVSYVDLTTVGPTVTVNVGPTGKVLVMASAFIGLNAPGGLTASATVFYGPSFATQGPGMALSTSGTTGMAATTTQVRRVDTGLPNQAVTFKLLYKVTANSANFSNRFLLVQPL